MAPTKAVGSWLVKAVLAGAVGAHRWDGRLQLDEARFLHEWRQAQRHLQAHYVHGERAPALQTVVELGTGWYPIVPLGLALSGACTVLSFDPAPILRADRVVASLKMYRRLAGAGKLPQLEPDACDRIDDVLRRSSGRAAPWLLDAFGIWGRRADARSTKLPAGIVDLFVSNNTLEHIPGDVLAGIFREFRRVAHRGSVMSHLSRLRPADYRRLHRETDWVLLEEDLHSEPRTVLRSIANAPQLRDVDADARRVVQVWTTSAPAPETTH